MDVASFPLNEEIAKAQVALQNSMTEAFAGRGALNVIVKNDGAASASLSMTMQPFLCPSTDAHTKRQLQMRQPERATKQSKK